jgi:hypothetical protein
LPKSCWLLCGFAPSFYPRITRVKMNKQNHKIQQDDYCVISGGQNSRWASGCASRQLLDFPQYDNSPCLRVPSLPLTTDDNWP